MKRKLLIAVAVLGLAFGIVAAVSRISSARTFQFFGEIVPRITTEEKVIALTFDDGPTPEFTDEILRILNDEGVKATFFLIGGEIERNPNEAKKIIEAGHEVGNHSFSHMRMVFVTPNFVRSEVDRTDELIKQAGYDKPTHFRPPYGKKLLVLPYYLSQANKTTITWDIEPESSPEVARSSDAIRSHVVDAAKPGSIVLLHVMYDRRRTSMNAVKPIVADLKGKGYRFVTVSELLGR